MLKINLQIADMFRKQVNRNLGGDVKAEAQDDEEDVGEGDGDDA